MTDRCPLSTRAVDAHCHVDLFPDPAAIVREAEEAGVALIAVTNAPSVFAISRTFTEGSKLGNTAIGLHPQLAQAREAELGLFDEFLPVTDFVGEIGLDFTDVGPSERRVQERVFSSILDRCVKLGPKVISVHSRRASGRAIEMIGPDFPGSIILHWFSGSIAELESAVACGMYLSVNSAMLSSKKGMDIVARAGPERILTESDGPFVQIGDRPASPRDMKDVLVSLSQLWQCAVPAAAERVCTNYARAVGGIHRVDGSD